MRTWSTKIRAISWMIAALLLMQLVQVGEVQARKYANYRVDGEPLTDPEIYILDQVKDGNGADLIEHFVLPLIPDKDRREEVKKLGLTGYLEKLDDGGKQTFLKRYEDELRIRARFLEILLIDGFPDFKIHRHGVMIENALIEEPLDFEDAEVTHNFGLAGSILQKGAIFRDSWFKKILLLSKVQFLGETDFRRLEVGKGLAANEAQFLNETQEVSFNGLKVGKNVNFKNATFTGPVNFIGADIGGQFQANGAKFLNERENANFNSMKVRKNAIFENANFKGPVDFVAADISGQFSATGAQFLNQKETAIFNSMKVGQNAIFENVNFKGPVDFVAADISGQFSATGAQFLNEKEAANFNSIKVGQKAVFRKVTFKGPVSFVTADIREELVADGARFLHKGSNTFERIRTGQTAFFRDVIFNGEINFSYGNFLDLIIKCSEKIDDKEKKELKDIIILNLKGAKIQRNFEIKDIKIPEEIKSILLDGLTYDSICVGEPGDYQKVIELVDRSRFNTQNYLQLESFFKHCGHEEWGNRAIISMKDQELASRPWPGRWLIKVFWGWLAGYGRHPLRVFWISLGIVVIGASLFDPKYLEEGKRPPSGNIYRSILVRFFLSLDQFLPAVDMNLAKDWKAADNSFFIWAYFSFEQISGYILVPLGLAAIYTQIK